jgi:hypothetical protein
MENPSTSDIILYTTAQGHMRVEVIYEGETFWLSQKRMAVLFGVDRTVITKHLKHIFAENELGEDSVCAFFAHTAEDGKSYQTRFYNLDAIIAVGYRVNSFQATQFRIWATKTLKEYIIKGFVLDDERMKKVLLVAVVLIHSAILAIFCIPTIIKICFNMNAITEINQIGSVHGNLDFVIKVCLFLQRKQKVMNCRINGFNDCFFNYFFLRVG